MAIKSTTIESESSSRLLFIDNLRTSLIALVVLHHVAVVYGAVVTPFYYFEPPFTDPLAFLVLLVFALFNQAWFMGALFLLSGYFTPSSFDRKGLGYFLKDRLLRLGIPLIIFVFVLSPISWTGLWQVPATLTGITNPLTWQAYPKLLDIGRMGPLWFVTMLLIFNFGYAVWRMLMRKRKSEAIIESSPPGYLSIVVFILTLAGVSYLLRMVIPLGKDVLGFPTLAYLPQYLSLFVLGAVASQRNWFRTLPSSMGIVGLGTALVVGVLLFPLAFSGHLFSLEITPALTNFTGNGQWQSAVYVLWDSAFAVGMCLGALTLFRRFCNGQGKLGRFLSQHSYTVYIIHIPIVVFLTAFVLKGIELVPLLKFGIVAVIAVPVSFTIAYIVRKIPLASRIL
ncbi:acyltransferase family protein [Chloroflexota bacterium]